MRKKKFLGSGLERKDFSACKIDKSKIVAQGAEALLIKKGEIMIKRRVEKNYRIKELDEKLRRLRTRSEAKLLGKAGKLISVPRVLKVDEGNKEILMDFVSGLKLSEKLDSVGNWREICLEIGKSIARLHNEGIIHGDLTTSNMIWVDNEKRLYFIDFGLGFANGRTEDKAVDLYLIKCALEAKHFKKFGEYFEAILEGYKSVSKNAAEVLKRLGAVERRGRYKQSY